MEFAKIQKPDFNLAKRVYRQGFEVFMVQTPNCLQTGLGTNVYSFG
ncbi:hypothetical protein [Bartonella massiliensis]|nr:hypothetical protein [Bartonella massiliensis]